MNHGTRCVLYIYKKPGDKKISCKCTFNFFNKHNEQLTLILLKYQQNTREQKICGMKYRPFGLYGVNTSTFSCRSVRRNFTGRRMPLHIQYTVIHVEIYILLYFLFHMAGVYYGRRYRKI
jgi:hypothetical protein